MSKDREKKLRRLAKTISVLHRMEASELARVSAACVELREREAGVRSYLDANRAGNEYFAELALARAARLRENLAQTEAQLKEKMELTAKAIAKAEGAKKRVNTVATLTKQISAARTLDEVIEAIVRRSSA